MGFMQLIFLAVVLVVAMDATKEDKGNEATCMCAVFGQKEEDQIIGEPLMTKAINFQAACDENGANDCGRLCKTLGEAGAAQDSQELCEAIRNTEKPLRPSIYSKFCAAEQWIYSGLTASQDYCCAEGKHSVCEAVTE